MPPPPLPQWVAGLLMIGLALRWSVGAWILLRAWRIRGRTELAIGAFILLLALSEATVVLSTALRGEVSRSLLLGLGIVTLALLVAGAVAMADGLRRLFHPGSRWLGVGVAGFFVFLVVASWQRYLGSSGAFVVTGGGVAGTLLMSSVLLLDLWWGTESALMIARLRKRAALGLGDDEALRRFGLWVIAAVAHATMIGAMLFSTIVLQQPAVSFPGLLAFASLAGIVSALAVLGSFLVHGDRGEADARARSATA